MSAQDWVCQPTAPLDLAVVAFDPAANPYAALFADSDYPGCGVCWYQEDADWGQIRTAPPEGCRVHTPWAFPGYSLSQEATP